MYTDEDLNLAVKNGTFTSASVEEFRQAVALSKSTVSVDEENFRLIGGFNDIFVVIACCLLLFSSLSFLTPIDESLGYLCFVAISWGLAEFFVLKRKMSLPAVVLLGAFVGGVFYLFSALFSNSPDNSLVAGTAAAAIAAYIHWLRFKVPITVAAGTAAGIGFIVSLLLSLYPNAETWLLYVLFIAGVSAFIFAMYWDSADTLRVTRKSDVAFWLHLVSAPLIIHPVFLTLGVLEGNESQFNIVVVLALYLLMSLVSLIIDRRAFMVSSLVYVIYALSSVMETYGGIGYGFAITGTLMGAFLLMLSAFWHVSRKQVVQLLPLKLKRYIPSVSE